MTKPNIELTENRVLIKKIEEKPAGGIEVPEGTGTETMKHLKGEVICIGELCKKIKEGDVVLFRDGYSKLQLEGEEFHIAREDSIVGIIKDHA